MWADETSRLSRFRMLFTSFADRESLPEVIPPCAFIHCSCNSDLLWFLCGTAGPMKLRLTLLGSGMPQTFIDSDSLSSTKGKVLCNFSLRNS